MLKESPITPPTATSRPQSLLDELMTLLPSVRGEHAPSSRLHQFLKRAARQEIERTFSTGENPSLGLGPCGEIAFPYHRMGKIDSLNLFDLDELILFSFYSVNRGRYRRAVDIGANIGLHSVVLANCGYRVRSYEPDPEHFRILQRNLGLNESSSVDPINAAVSSCEGTLEFVRVVDNTTGSHLAGAKSNPYGKLDRFPVRVESIATALADVDLMKLDAEGHEKEILLATSRDQWLKTDALVEVGSNENAAGIWQHFSAMQVNLFAQKINWAQVKRLEDMPASYRDGSLFISIKPVMPWGDAPA
jgi:FkbM family methyltransferase